jgi:DDE superfamily endonuclease
MIDPATFNTLRLFRDKVYECFDARRDALFELLDAATLAGLVPSLAYLSLSPVHRRQWGSLYDALAAGRLDAAALRELIAGYPLDEGQPIYALDTSIWPRDDAETSPGRGALLLVLAAVSWPADRHRVVLLLVGAVELDP